MGLVLDPGFAGNRRFYSCQGVDGGGRRRSPSSPGRSPRTGARATRVADPLIGGIPVNAASGRHGGCRLRFDPGRGAADRHRGQRRRQQPAGPASLAGKVLLADPADAAEVGRSGPTGTATCRAWPCGRAPARSSRWSRAPAATTR